MDVAGVAIYKFAIGKLKSFLVSYIYVLNQSIMSFRVIDQCTNANLTVSVVSFN